MSFLVPPVSSTLTPVVVRAPYYDFLAPQVNPIKPSPSPPPQLLPESLCPQLTPDMRA